MNGPSAQALREGGVGGSLRYKTGTTLVVRIANGSAPPSAWKRKTTLQSEFGEFGQIMRIDIPEGQGMAYIEYDDKRDAEEAAHEMDGKKICGLIVSVQVLTAHNGGPRGGPGGGGDVQTRIEALAQEHGLDAAAAARLVSVFTERVRMGCDLNRDISELSDHLGASNKPSALVSMKLAELRSGQPIGPCKYNKGGRSDGISEDGGSHVSRSRGDRDRREVRSGVRERRERRYEDPNSRTSGSRERHRDRRATSQERGGSVGGRAVDGRGDARRRSRSRSADRFSRDPRMKARSR
mmetsp:Transcript_26652/g.58564  ORF Transcript_26652/g.58564 Transcript_26652/m.58564 type:complete len:295 (-) Transcript_26652:83-967(-)